MKCRHRINLGFLVFLAILISYCGRNGSHQSSQSPAKVQNAVKETDLTTITLTEEAESRLGIESTAVELKKVNMTQTYGGEVLTVSGQEIKISAPLPGVVLTSSKGNTPLAGGHVEKGQSVCRIVLLPPEKDVLSAKEDVTLKQVQLEVAQSRAKRAEQLLKSKAGSVKELEQAQSDLASAEAALKVSRARLDVLTGENPLSAAEELSSLDIESPVTGVIQKVHITPGQIVAAGTPLIEISGINPLWIRVPVYVGELKTIDITKSAKIHELSDFKGESYDEAHPIPSPFTAESSSASADLFFELQNKDKKFRPGQKVSVTLTLKTSEESLVVPFSAILYDMHGSVWVYEKISKQTYVRKRIELKSILGDIAIVSRGLNVGAQIVTAGAAELFGTEFGVGK